MGGSGFRSRAVGVIQLKLEQWVPGALGGWPGISLRESQGGFLWPFCTGWVVFPHSMVALGQLNYLHCSLVLQAGVLSRQDRR